MKKIYLMKIEKLLCILLASSVFCFSAIAQTNKTAQGIITDEKGIPLSGVTVSVKGAVNESITTSDARGKFKISVPENSVLVFTYVGMSTVEERFRGQSTMSITMQSASAGMDEVVVIGYGTVKKKDLTGSVSSIKGEDIQKTSISSFQQGFKGRLAGVEVVQGDATPGGGAYIQIRGVSTMLGSTEPLYVVDGVPMNIATSGGTTSAAGFSNTNPLATIPPSDIESVEVLKDASATAIYGSLGANGVVMITTKKGKAGSNKITFNTTQSVSVLSKKIQVLNALQYAEYKNENYANAYPYNPVSNWDFPLNNTDSTKLSPDQLEALVGKGIDWQDEIYRPAPVQDYQLTFSGGNAGTTYAVMANYLNQQGILKNTAFKRGGLRMNLDQKLSNRIKLSTSVSFTRSSNRLVKTSTNDGSAQSGGVVRKALTYSPIPALAKDPTTGKIIGISTGDPADYDMDDPSYQNNWGATPLRYLQEAKVMQSLTNITGSLGLQIQLAKGLTVSMR